MGTGKTSTGRMLAKKLGYSAIDLDQKIEATHQMTIPEIFTKYGEEYFRNLETEVVKTLPTLKNTVISTGGGTVKRSENRELLRSAGIIISLHASVDAVLQRTARRGERPVLDQKDHGDRREAVKELMESRKALYEQADYIIDTSELTLMQVVSEIQHFLKRRGTLHAKSSG